ncbi:unnamed protein product, partial [Sphacelaria rigidula]
DNAAKNERIYIYTLETYHAPYIHTHSCCNYITHSDNLSIRESTSTLHDGNTHANISTNMQVTPPPWNPFVETPFSQLQSPTSAIPPTSGILPKRPYPPSSLPHSIH